jgi:hypothetical protein
MKLTVARILDTIDHVEGRPKKSFWSLWQVWKGALYHAGVRLDKDEFDKWMVDASAVTEESLSKACNSHEFAKHAHVEVKKALDSLRVIYADDAEKLALIERLVLPYPKRADYPKDDPEGSDDPEEDEN